VRPLPNLASDPLLNTRPVWLLTAAMVALAAGLLAVNLHLYFDAGHTTAELRERRAELEAERSRLLESVRADVERLDRVPWRKIRRRVAAYNRVLEQHAFSWTVLLADLGEALPRDVRLTRVSPKVEEGKVVLALGGVARSREAMLRFLENLIGDPRFAEPVPRSEETPEGAGAPGYLFSLRVRYRPGGSP